MLYVSVWRKLHPVEGLKEARELFLKRRAKYAFRLCLRDGFVYDGARLVVKIDFSGRIWEPDADFATAGWRAREVRP